MMSKATTCLLCMVLLFCAMPSQATIAYQSACAAAVLTASGTSLGSGGISCTAGWIVVVQCSGPAGRTYSMSDSTGGSNTWNRVNTGIDWNTAANHQEVFWTIIQATTSGVTCAITGGAAFMDMSVNPYSSTSGWASSALDSPTYVDIATSASPISLTSPNPNVNAEELELAMYCSGGNLTDSAPTAGWTKRQSWDGASCEVWDKFSSGIETAALSYTTNASPKVGQLMSFKEPTSSAGGSILLGVSGITGVATLK